MYGDRQQETDVLFEAQQRQRETERERQRQRETETERDREIDRQSAIQRERGAVVRLLPRNEEVCDRQIRAVQRESKTFSSPLMRRAEGNDAERHPSLTRQLRESLPCLSCL